MGVSLFIKNILPDYQYTTDDETAQVSIRDDAAVFSKSIHYAVTSASSNTYNDSLKLIKDIGDFWDTTGMVYLDGVVYNKDGSVVSPNKLFCLVTTYVKDKPYIKPVCGD